MTHTQSEDTMTSGWKTVKLEEIADYVREKVRISQLDESTYVSTENMLPNKGGIVPASTLPTGTLTQAFKCGDVLVSNIRPYFKKIWFATFDGGCSADVLVFRAKSGIDSSFLRYALSNDSFFAHSMASSKGTKMPRGDKQSIMRYEVPDVPLDVQRRIAAVLKPLDDKIELNARINARLERVAQALFKRHFVRIEPYGGTMPPGWRVGTLGELLSVVESGSRPKGGAENSGIPSIGAENIERFGVYDYSKDKFISESFFLSLKRGIVQSGDVLLYKDGAYTGKVSMALDSFPHERCAVNEHVFILRTKDKCFQFTLYFTLLRDEIRQRIATLAAGKAAQPGLNQNELRSVPIVIPTQDEMLKFETFAAPLMHMIAHNARQSRTLAHLRDVLLPRLMSGAVDVRQVRLNTMQEGGSR